MARRIDTPDATAEALRAALDELFADPETARRSAQLRAEARSEGGIPRAVGLIEDMLALGGVRDCRAEDRTRAQGPT